MPCYIERLPDGRTMFLCGSLGPHCADESCGASSGFLCDFPVVEGKTCDLPLCRSHAYEVAPNVHYCHGHLLLWQAFRNSGGVMMGKGHMLDRSLVKVGNKYHLGERVLFIVDIQKKGIGETVCLAPIAPTTDRFWSRISVEFDLERMSMCKFRRVAVLA